MEYHILNYFAGLFDAEGYANVQNRKQGPTPSIAIGMSEEKSIKEFADFFNLNISKRTFSDHRKDMFYAEGACRKAEYVASLLYPFCINKKDNLKKILDHYKHYIKDIPWESLDKEQKLNYFAGLIDGDGCIGLYDLNSKKGLSPTVSIRMTAKDTINTFANYFNGPTNIREYKNPNHNTTYNCIVTYIKALNCCEQLQPYLRIKRNKSVEIINYYKDKNCLWCGKVIPSPASARRKYCSPTCTYAYSNNKKKLAKEKGGSLPL